MVVLRKGPHMNMEKELLLQLLMEKYGKQVTPNINGQKNATPRSRIHRKKHIWNPENRKRSNNSWTSQEDEFLLHRWHSGDTFKQIGLVMERSTGAVEIRFRQKLNPNLQSNRA